jgi:hypothetical protein
MKIKYAIAFLLGTTACGANRPEDPPPEHVIGKYRYVGKGSVAKQNWDARAELLLERDGQYTLDLRLHIADEDEHETSFGTYYVTGDKLVLEPADENEHDGFDEFLIRGNRLEPKMGWHTKLGLKALKVQPVFVKAD